jgi:hypothetical protein
MKQRSEEYMTEVEEVPEQAANDVPREFADLNKAYFEQKARIEAMKEALTEENKKLMQIEGKLAAVLDELGWKSFRSPHGTVGIKEIWSYRLPKTPEDKSAFFDYLKERGVFENLVSVHSQTFQSFCAAEARAAKEEGRLPSIPGVDAPALHKSLYHRKGK